MAKGSIKFKDSVADFERISKDIKGRKFSSIYLLMGEESYFIDSLCDQLSNSILDPATQSFSQITVYGKDSEAGLVVNMCRQVPMMGKFQVVIVKEAQQLRGIEKLALYTKKPSPSTILIICHKDKGLDKRSQLYKSILSGGLIFESIRPRDYEIATWLTQFINSKGLTIDSKSSSMLIDYLGTNISNISNELEKLMVSLPSGVKAITDGDIEKNIGISKEFNNFELCNAVLSKNMMRSLTIAEHFAHNPKNNPLLVTIMALFGQFKKIFIVNYLNWQTRYRGAAVPSDMELMSILKLNNIYAIRELKQVATTWNNKKVFEVLGLLREYDAKSKGVDTGGATDRELLRELLLKILI